jgi:hypothetical protein
MDFELHPTVSPLKVRSFNVLVAPREHFIAMLNRNLNLQRYKVLFVTGNDSGILSRLHRRFIELEIRRGFTTFQLMTILEEACHSLIIVEHDPLLHEDSNKIVEHIQQASFRTADLDLPRCWQLGGCGKLARAVDCTKCCYNLMIYLTPVRRFS